MLWGAGIQGRQAGIPAFLCNMQTRYNKIIVVGSRRMLFVIVSVESYILLGMIIMRQRKEELWLEILRIR